LPTDLAAENVKDLGEPRRGVNESDAETIQAILQPSGLDVHQQTDVDAASAEPSQTLGIVGRQQRGGDLDFDGGRVRHQEAGASAWGPSPGLYEAKKDDGGTVQADAVIIAQPPDALPEVRLRDGRDLVHHQAAGEPQPVLAVRIRQASASILILGRPEHGFVQHAQDGDLVTFRKRGPGFDAVDDSDRDIALRRVLLYPAIAPAFRQADAH